MHSRQSGIRQSETWGVIDLGQWLVSDNYGNGSDLCVFLSVWEDIKNMGLQSKLHMNYRLYHLEVLIAYIKIMQQNL